MQITSIPWGLADGGAAVDLYTLSNDHGLQATLTTFGAGIVSLLAPDRRGRLGDVILGSDRLEGYLEPRNVLGVVVGRVANRIAGSSVTLNGITYHLTPTNGTVHLHGGKRGFGRVVWSGAVERTPQPRLRLSYRSVDGEEGYPGNLDVTVFYSLTNDNELRLEYDAISDKDTIVNLTNHVYFNLAGAGDILGHTLAIDADAFTPADATQIPTGEIRPVAGTPLDFRRPIAIGARINDPYDQLHTASGYDHNYVLNHKPGVLAKFSEVADAQSGRVMEAYTTEPGVQLYTANHLNGLTGKGGVAYGKYAGVCLEAQHFPDAPHHPNFPSIVVRAGDHYRQITTYRFLCR
jgi:aldose 1-epimerase